MDGLSNEFVKFEQLRLDEREELRTNVTDLQRTMKWSQEANRNNMEDISVRFSWLFLTVVAAKLLH